MDNRHNTFGALLSIHLARGDIPNPSEIFNKFEELAQQNQDSDQNFGEPGQLNWRSFFPGNKIGHQEHFFFIPIFRLLQISTPSLLQHFLPKPALSYSVKISIFCILISDLSSKEHGFPFLEAALDTESQRPIIALQQAISYLEESSIDFK